jgi:hypothetical protein
MKPRGRCLVFPAPSLKKTPPRDDFGNPPEAATPAFHILESLLLHESGTPPYADRYGRTL